MKTTFFERNQNEFEKLDLENNLVYRVRAEKILAECFKRLTVVEIHDRAALEAALDNLEYKSTNFENNSTLELVLIPEIDAIPSQLGIETWAHLQSSLEKFWYVLGNSSRRAAIVSMKIGGFFDRQNATARREIEKELRERG